MHKHKKKYGQNFIKDANLIKKIVQSAEIENKNVLEIGPGMGALTKLLVKDAKKYLGFEIDISLSKILTNFVNDNVTFYYIDFLNKKTDEIIKDYFKDENIYLVSNLPYNITSPVIFKLFEISNIKEATLMVQKEVADRMLSLKDGANYSAFSVILNYYVDVIKIMDVNRNLFKPVPKVDSAVVRLIKKEPRLPKETEKELIKLIKTSFLHRRKKLSNNLEGYNNLTKNDINDIFSYLNINLESRAQSLDLDDYIKINNKIINKSPKKT